MKNTPLTFTRALGLVALCSTLVLVGCGGGGSSKKSTTAPTAVVNHGPLGSLGEDGLDGTGTDCDPTLLGDVNGPDYAILDVSDDTIGTTAANPEPGTAALALLGGLGLLTVVTRRKRHAQA